MSDTLKDILKLAHDLLEDKKELSMLLVQVMLAVEKGMFLPNTSDFKGEPMELYEDIKHYLSVGTMKERGAE